MKTILLFAFIVLSSCGVPEKEHIALKRDFDALKIELANTQQEKSKVEDTLEKQLKDFNQKIAEMEKQRDELQASLDETNASLSMFESKTGGLEAALKATKSELEELRKQRMRAEKRLSQYRNLAKKLASMVESGKLSVKVRNGKMVIQLANAILFESGKANLKKDGEAALGELAAVLASIDKRDFLVSGHTDNVPMRSGKFKSNWELSTARAVNVVTFLQNSGVSPKVMAAAGYGEFDPVASNESADGKASNRRIEIILMPNLDELPGLPTNLLEK